MACGPYKYSGAKKTKLRKRVKKDKLEKRCCSSNIVELTIAMRQVGRLVSKPKLQLFEERKANLYNYWKSKILGGSEQRAVVEKFHGPNSESESREIMTDFGERIIIDLGQCGEIYLKKDPYYAIDHIVGLNPGFLNPVSQKLYGSNDFKLKIQNMLKSSICSGLRTKNPINGKTVPQPEKYVDLYYGTTEVIFSNQLSDPDVWFGKLGLNESEYSRDNAPPLFVHNATGNLIVGFSRITNGTLYGPNDPEYTLDMRAFKIGHISDANIYDIIKKDKLALYDKNSPDDITCAPTTSLQYFLTDKKPPPIGLLS